MRLIPLLIFFSMANCSFAQTLNDSIAESQKKACTISPYKNANEFSQFYLPAQSQYRLRQLPLLIKNKLTGKEKLSDTLWLWEDYPAETDDLRCFSIEVLYNDTLYLLRRPHLLSPNPLKLEKKIFSLCRDKNCRFDNQDLIEIVSRVRKGLAWQKNPLQYGTDGCMDGDHTMITVVYPNRNIESLYVRCLYISSSNFSQ